jgi:hypothetical protein
MSYVAEATSIRRRRTRVTVCDAGAERSTTAGAYLEDPCPGTSIGGRLGELGQAA